MEDRAFQVLKDLIGPLTTMAELTAELTKSNKELTEFTKEMSRQAKEMAERT